MSKWPPQQNEALALAGAWMRIRQSQVFYLASFAGTGKTTLAMHLAKHVKGKVSRWRLQPDIPDAPRPKYGTKENMMAPRQFEPTYYPPRGMSRDEAARYIGVGPTKFDEMVTDGRMPRPRKIDGRVIWDRVSLDAAFSDLPVQANNRIDQLLSGG